MNFPSYLRYVWPWQRMLARKLARRCSRCIVSEKYAGLTDGVCDECREYVPVPRTSKSQPVRIAAKSEAHRYDCVLLLSGGKDSTYVLGRLRVERPDLRILALFVDNGFSSPLAIRNVEHAVNATSTDVLILRSEVPRFREVFREAFLSLRGRPSAGIVDFADGKLIFEIGRTVACYCEYVPLVSGLSAVQVLQLTGKPDVEQWDHGICSAYPLAAWQTSETEIRQYIADHKLLPPGSSSPLSTNNDLIFTMSALDILALGYCSFEPEFGRQVRQGLADRTFWLHAFECLEWLVNTGRLDKEIDANLARLGLTRQEVLP